jgi:hypothetical protein
MTFSLALQALVFLVARVVLLARAAAPRSERLIRRELPNGVPGTGVPESLSPASLLQASRLNASDDKTPANEHSITFSEPAATATKRRPQDDCYDAVDVAAVGDDLEANRDFWKNKCYMFSREIAAIRVTMGKNIDYFKPQVGNTNKAWCSMIQSNQKHLWSKDAINWKQPVYVKSGDYADFLGGSDQTWPVSQGQDEREFLTFWGGAKVNGGCCSDKEQWDKNQWEEKFVLSTCNRCSTLATIPGAIVADKKYFQQLCSADTLPDSATMIRVTIGFVVDYFKPIQGASICDMLQSNNKHLWSDDGINFRQPRYNMTSHLGGSATGWPKANVLGEQRQTLNFWGSTQHEGGCCSTSLRDECDHGQIETCFLKPVEIEYCRDFGPTRIHCPEEDGPTAENATSESTN